LTVPARRQSVLALNYTAISVGYTLGVIPAGFLADKSYQLLAAASFGGFTLVAALALFGLRGTMPTEGPASPRRSLLADTLRAFRDPPFARLVALAFLLPVSLGLASIVLPLYAAEYGMERSIIGIVLGTNGILLALLALPVNAAVESRGPFRCLPLAAACCAASLVAFSLSAGALALVLGLAVFTVGETLFSAALPTAVAALAPAGHRGAYQGAYSMVFAVGIGASFFLGGIARDALGWPLTWLLFAALLAATAAGFLVTRASFQRAMDLRRID
jgi:predicted MFS family arabinose efflux permease